MNSRVPGGLSAGASAAAGAAWLMSAPDRKGVARRWRRLANARGEWYGECFGSPLPRSTAVHPPSRTQAAMTPECNPQERAVVLHWEGMAVAAILLAARFQRPAADPLRPRTTTSGVVRASAIATTPAPPASHAAGARHAPPPVRREVARPAMAAARTPVPGMVVAIDPETGTLGPPSPEQMREIQSHRADDLPRESRWLRGDSPPGWRGGSGARGPSAIVLRGAGHPDGRRAFGCLEASSDSAAAAAPLTGEDR